MAVDTTTIKKIVMVVLVAICIGLVYRNFPAPAKNNVPATTVAGGSANRGARAASPPQSRNQSGRTMDQQALARMDPTLRLDLLEKSRQATYDGSFRNIFQAYVPPPPKPVVDPVLPLPAKPAQAPSKPPPPTIPLKFYGVASRRG